MDDVGLPQNEKEEMKELLKSGWHHVKIHNKGYSMFAYTFSLDVSIGKRYLWNFTVSIRR